MLTNFDRSLALIHLFSLHILVCHQQWLRVLANASKISEQCPLTTAPKMIDIFGNGTAHASRWEPSPTRRGTFDILAPCTITMLLCIWTSLHLNFPAATESRWERFKEKVLWLVAGLLAPEYVSYFP